MPTNQNCHASGHKNGPKTIIVNGRPKKFVGDTISYAQVVEIAFPGESNCEVVFTLTYMGPQMPDGTLVEGQSIEVRNGMKFNVNKTNRS
jgi:hypothetical protein